MVSGMVDVDDRSIPVFVTLTHETDNSLRTTRAWRRVKCEMRQSRLGLMMSLIIPQYPCYSWS
jgi:hypothetical protein